MDGSFFKAGASAGGIFTAKKPDDQPAALEKKIDARQGRLAEQEARDDRAGLGSLAEGGEPAGKLARPKERQAEKQAPRTRLEASGEGQISAADPDARPLGKKGKAAAGYNVQIAVDAKHKPIAASEATRDGNDRQQLVPVLERAQGIPQSGHLAGPAGTGYHGGEQIRQAEERGFAVYAPGPRAATAAEKDGRLARDRFQCDEAEDRHARPNGEALEACGKPQQRDGKPVQAHKSKASARAARPLRPQRPAEKAAYKKLERWPHEAAAERHRLRMAKAGGRMKKRGELAGHPFGTLKHRAGMRRFLVRGREKCRGEPSLAALCRNFTRALDILGCEALRDYCARRSGNQAKMVQCA